MDYDKIVSSPQATRYVVNFMHQIGLLQQFQYVIPEDDDDDELTDLAAGSRCGRRWVLANDDK